MCNENANCNDLFFRFESNILVCSVYTNLVLHFMERVKQILDLDKNFSVTLKNHTRRSEYEIVRFRQKTQSHIRKIKTPVEK